MRIKLTNNERNALEAVSLNRSLARNAVARAIAGTKKTSDAVMYEISKDIRGTPGEVEKFYQGNALSLWEIRDFARWKGKLPDEKQILLILQYGVSVMQKLFI